MDERKIHIIDKAIGLFAKKGFYSTSIQEIADESGVSKGAVYLHFRSKDELLLEIFRYYFGKMREKITRVEEESLPPKKSFIRQLQIQFEEINKHKEFIIMQFREQALSTNKEVGQFLRIIRYETHKWYETSLINIYGDKVKPYVIDGELLLEGIKNSYFQMLILNDFDIDLAELASFMIKRLDDLMQGMINKNEKPMVTKEMFDPIFKNVQSPKENLQEEVEKYLSEMRQILSGLSMTEEKADELQGSLDFLEAEIQKQEPKKFIFQGMLTNFKGIEEFNKHRRLIADRLDIELL